MGRQKIVSFLFILAIPIAANAQDVHEKRDTLRSQLSYLIGLSYGMPAPELCQSLR